LYVRPACVSGILNQFFQTGAGIDTARDLATCVGDPLYWSGSLTDYIYMVPEVIGKPAAIVPASLETRFGG